MQVWKKTLAGSLAVATVVLAGCQSTSGSVYSREEARREQTVRMAVVESVRSVTIEADRTPIGGLAGGAIGGVAGSNVGGGKGAIIGTIIGAVGGALAGTVAEGRLTRRQGQEITVKLDNGDMRAIVQDADEQFRPGERVRLVSQAGVTRVSH